MKPLVKRPKQHNHLQDNGRQSFRCPVCQRRINLTKPTLFGTSKSNISMHIANILKDKELNMESLIVPNGIENLLTEHVILCVIFILLSFLF